LGVFWFEIGHNLKPDPPHSITGLALLNIFSYLNFDNLKGLWKMDRKVKFKSSSTKLFSNISSIPSEDRKEMEQRLKEYRKQISDEFDMCIKNLNQDVSWDAITDHLSQKLESMGEEIKVWEPNECNDRGW
jgi:RNA recognition motif-containing protein